MAEIPTPTTGYSAPSGDRPLGVTIIAILQIIGNLIVLSGAVIIMMGAALIPFFGAIFLILGAIMTLFAIFGLVVGWGLWSLKSWAWMIALILNILNIILNIFSGQYIAIIIPLIIVIYLQQGEVKSTFR